MGATPSSRATGLDQIPEALLPLFVLKGILGLTLVQIAGFTFAFFVLEIPLAWLTHRIGLRESPLLRWSLAQARGLNRMKTGSSLTCRTNRRELVVADVLRHVSSAEDRTSACAGLAICQCFDAVPTVELLRELGVWPGS